MAAFASFLGVVDYDKEDGGQALIATIYEQEGVSEDNENGMFVRIQSWHTDADELPEEERHPMAMKLAGKKVRVTIEVIE